MAFRACLEILPRDLTYIVMEYLNVYKEVWNIRKDLRIFFTYTPYPFELLYHIRLQDRFIINTLWCSL